MSYWNRQHEVVEAKAAKRAPLCTFTASDARFKVFGLSDKALFGRLVFWLSDSEGIIE